MGTDSTHIKVLHIDDEADQCTFTKTFLEQLNPIFQVTSTQDPAILVHELNTGDYDCVVSDFKMPQVNGIQLARSIREYSSVPFILYTGQGSEEVAEKALALGVNYYVRKETWPSHYQVLEKSILTAVEKYRVEERLRQSQRELSWMVENSPDAILRIEFDLGVARCNPAAEEMLGISRGTHITYDSVLEHIHPDDRRKIRELKQMSFEDRRQETLTFRWMKDGDIEIWLEASVIPIVLDRKPIGIELIARDITDRMRTEETLRRKLEIEQTVSEVAGLFVRVENFDSSIDEALRLIGELSGASRAYLFEFDENREVMDNTHEWCSPGIASERQTLQGLPRYMFPWWMKKLEKGENLHIRDVSKMPPEAATEKMLLETQGIKSLLVIPFYIDKTLDGFIGFDNVVNTGKWGKDDLMLLRISADLIGAAMLRHRIKKEKNKSRLVLEQVL